MTKTIKFLNWLGSQSKLLNGAVISWFLMGIFVGMAIGACLIAFILI